MDIGYMPREANHGQVGSLEKPWASVVADNVVINLDGEYVPVGTTFVQKTSYEADQARVSMLLTGLRTDVDVVTADARTTRESLPEFSDYTRTLLKQPSEESWRASLAVPKVDGSDASGTWAIDISGQAVRALQADSASSASTDSLGRKFEETYLTEDDLIFENLALNYKKPDTDQILATESVLELNKHPLNDEINIVQLCCSNMVIVASSAESSDYGNAVRKLGTDECTAVFGKKIAFLTTNGVVTIYPDGTFATTNGFAVEVKLGTSAVAPAVGNVVGVYTGAAECCTRATTSTPVIGVCTAVVGQNVVCVVSGVTTVNVTGSVSIGSMLYVNSSGVCTTSGSNKVGIALSTPVNGTVRVLVRP